MAPIALLFAALVTLQTTSGAVKTEILPVAQFTVPFTGQVPRSAHKNVLLEVVRSQKNNNPSNYTALLAGAELDLEYLTDITVGAQKFKVIVDTGSSGTWLAKKGFKCYNLTSYPEPQSTCGFGTSGFDPSKSKTFVSYPDKNFNISYGDGQFLTGVVGFETMTVGGMTVAKQEFGLITDAAWSGDGVNSGILGLAYPQLVDVYNGTNPENDSLDEAAPYNSFFRTAVLDNVVSNPYFSVAINRGTVKSEEDSWNDPKLGYLAFGGIAPVNMTSPTVTVPVQYFSILPGSTQEYSYYLIDIDSYVFEGTTTLTGSGKKAILDTGTTFNWLPSNIAKTYNDRFVPPATFNQDAGVYYVACNATIPDFEVEIGGQRFEIDGKDLILPAGTDANGKKVCISGTQDGGDPSNLDHVFILGQKFLHNVVATFNVQSNQITLTQRKRY